LFYGCEERSAQTPETGSEQSPVLQDSSVEPDVQEPTPAEDALLDQLYKSRYKGDLDDLANKRVIRALVVSSPMFYFLDGARERGITYEAMKEFESFLNKKLETGNLKISVVLIPVQRNQLLPRLAEGGGDIAAANLTITPERLKLVDFSTPALKNVSEIVVSSADAPIIKSLDDLSGKKIYVRTSSSYHESLLRLNENLRKAGKAPVIIDPADEILEDEDILEMVNADLIQWTVVDSTKTDFFKDIFEKVRIYPDLAVRSGGNVAWAVRKNSPKMLALIDEFVVGISKGTAFGNTLLKRYLRDNKWVKAATAQSERKNYLQVVDLFKKYGDQYDIPYLLMIAQAYQESQLNQNARSPVGALGIMQIKPDTAAGNPINIKQIEQLDNNIHAGVKYVRFIFDRYYKDAPMTILNKVLFSFASYNAGPARIARLREKAAARGLDPDVWFKNVELIAAREIGRETVQYVSNIYKYYLAYKALNMENKSEAKS
jgi:membrane-bound lytic murein transglycosylase MltF